jgi:hypothetical protein
MRPPSGSWGGTAPRQAEGEARRRRLSNRPCAGPGASAGCRARPWWARKDGATFPNELTATPPPEDTDSHTPAPDRHWLGLLAQLASALIPPRAETWQVQCAITHDAQGCTTIQLHTCLPPPPAETPPPEATPECAGYL